LTAEQTEPRAGISRRRLLAAGLGGSVVAVISAAAGVASASSSETFPMLGREDFDRTAAEIYDRHWQQDEETVQALRAKYQAPVFGRVRIWDLVEKLAFCVDPTDRTLYCTNQYIHVQQILEGMERDGVTDNDLILAALTHDLGKVALLTDEVPENVVCGLRPVEEYGEGVGLDHIFCQFGHDEIAYTRIKDHVPDFVAWLTRYHSMDPADMRPHMDDRDSRYYERYVTFRKYDLGTKSVASLPRIDMEKYRTIVEETFPSPILF
jgi:Myo-inositol oxygenase